MRRQKFLSQYLNGNSSRPIQLEPNNFQYLSAKPAMKTQLSLLWMISALTSQINIPQQLRIYRLPVQSHCLSPPHIYGISRIFWSWSFPLWVQFCSWSSDISIRPLHTRSACPVSGGSRNFERRRQKPRLPTLSQMHILNYTHVRVVYGKRRYTEQNSEANREYGRCPHCSPLWIRHCLTSRWSTGSRTLSHDFAVHHTKELSETQKHR